MQPFLRTAVFLLGALSTAGQASASDLFTSFEFTDLSGSFTLGTAPNQATFAGGEAKTILSPGMYHSGMFSWMITAGNTGTVTFQTAAKSVDFWFRDETALNGGVLTVVNSNGDAILTQNATTTWQHVVLEPLPQEAPITSVSLTNNGASAHSAIDDFSFFAVAGGGGPITDPIPAPIPLGSQKIRLIEVATGLIAPNWGISLPPSPSLPHALEHLLFVTDQNGSLWSVNPNSGSKVKFLDVSALLVPLGVAGPGSFDERGLLGVAFDPDYATNGLLYTYTSQPAVGVADFSTMPVGQNPNHHTVITEWNVLSPTSFPNAGDTASLVDPNSARELLRIDQPQFNHDGGCVNFGPDGLLYISLGDGGNGDDEGLGHSADGNGADAGNVLGTVLRIDPAGNNSANGNYGNPAGNPFVGDPTKPDEIYAYGLRNPFRFSFDVGTLANPGSNALYLADVGQNDIEEIDIITSGGNFGWRCREGAFFFDPNGAGAGFVTGTPPHTVPSGLIDPIAQYDHDEGLAIIGGFVYRGSRIPSLSGSYVFGDLARTFSADGRLFYLDGSDNVLEFQIVNQTDLGLFLLGFGQDASGELYVLANATGVPFADGGGNPTGVVLRIERDTGFLDLGKGKAGADDVVPHLDGTGPLTAGSGNTIALGEAALSTTATLVIGLNNVSLPKKGGILIPSTDAVFPGLPVDAQGDLVVPFTVPLTFPPGTTLFAQYWVQDAGVSFGLSASNGLEIITN